MVKSPDQSRTPQKPKRDPARHSKPDPAKPTRAKAALFQQGVDAETSTPEVLGTRIRADIVKWREVISKAGSSRSEINFFVTPS
jgi:hypothetical protein